eukprot:57025-Chlamydomonas_euryale.AAC.1
MRRLDTQAPPSDTCLPAALARATHMVGVSSPPCSAQTHRDRHLTQAPPNHTSMGNAPGWASGAKQRWFCQAMPSRRSSRLHVRMCVQLHVRMCVQLHVSICMLGCVPSCMLGCVPSWVDNTPARHARQAEQFVRRPVCQAALP